MMPNYLATRKRSLCHPVVSAWLVLGAVIAQSPVARDVAVVDVQTAVSEPWLAQEVAVTVRIALDRTFFAEQAMSLVRQRVDLPVQLVAPWLDESAGATLDIVDGSGPRLVFGERIVRATADGSEERGGRTFDVFAVHCTWAGSVVGEHVLAPVVLRYAYASAFEESLLGGRQPVDQNEAEVRSAELRLSVRDLPSVGRPESWTGAVGEFTVRAESSVAEVEVGDSFAVTLVVAPVDAARGGNLLAAKAPPWPELKGLVVQGMAEGQRDGARTFAFDVLALAENAPRPRLSFAWFSPRAGEYRSSETAPVEVAVVPRAAGRPLSPRVAKLIAARAAPVKSGTPWWVMLLAIPVGIGLIGLWARRRSTAKRAE